MVISTGLALAGLGANFATGLANTAANIWSQKDSQAFNSEEALKAREFNSAEAQKQRDWEQEMSSTAYQRAIADMKAAGLNPASIGAGASPASTPSGMAASGQAASGSSNRVGSFDSSYFSDLLSSATSVAMAKDRNIANKVIAEMYTTNAKEMASNSLAMKEYLNNLNWDNRKDLHEYDWDNRKDYQEIKDNIYWTNKRAQDSLYWKNRQEMNKYNWKNKNAEYKARRAHSVASDRMRGVRHAESTHAYRERTYEWSRKR